MFPLETSIPVVIFPKKSNLPEAKDKYFNTAINEQVTQ